VAGDVTCSLLVERGSCTDTSSSTLRFVRERCTLACGFCTSTTVYTTSTATTTASATTTTTTNNYDNASPDSGTTYVYLNSTHYVPPLVTWRHQISVCTSRMGRYPALIFRDCAQTFRVVCKSHKRRIFLFFNKNIKVGKP